MKPATYEYGCELVVETSAFVAYAYPAIFDLLHFLELVRQAFEGTVKEEVCRAHADTMVLDGEQTHKPFEDAVRCHRPSFRVLEGYEIGVPAAHCWGPFPSDKYWDQYTTQCTIGRITTYRAPAIWDVMRSLGSAHCSDTTVTSYPTSNKAHAVCASVFGDHSQC